MQQSWHPQATALSSQMVIASAIFVSTGARKPFIVTAIELTVVPCVFCHY
jgi:hypothetical protein